MPEINSVEGDSCGNPCGLRAVLVLLYRLELLFRPSLVAFEVSIQSSAYILSVFLPCAFIVTSTRPAGIHIYNCSCSLLKSLALSISFLSLQHGSSEYLCSLSHRDQDE
jgi:hypothetical protein